LYEKNVLAEDFSSLLRLLNQQRKDVWYEGEPPDFGDQDVEEVAEPVERLVEAAGDAAR